MLPLSPRIVSASCAWPFAPRVARRRRGRCRRRRRRRSCRCRPAAWRRRADVEVGAAADQVVLAEAAEDQVVAAAALDVVVAVGRRRRRCPGRSCPGVAQVPTSTRDRAVALDRVVAHLAEDQVVAGAAGEVVVAEHAAACGGAVVEERDRPLDDGAVERIDRRASRAMFGTHVIEPSPLTTGR